MKKQLLATLILVVSALAAYAQSKPEKENEKEWNIGVGAGPTFASMSIVETNSARSLHAKNLPGQNGGISVRYISENHLGLIGELNYSVQGWERMFDEGSAYKYTHKLSYIELPVLTHIYFGSKRIRFVTNLGPKLGYLLSESHTINDALQEAIAANPDNSEITPSVVFGKKAERKIDYGIMAGMGLELRTSIGNFMLEGRYYMGFGDIYKSNKSEPFSRSANRVISARLTYFIKAF